jgi:D-sedoheptulose 7-phosphate isomerase/D-glycero-D-manno-heptose 1,7-bisphosphate phosphatase
MSMWCIGRARRELVAGILLDRDGTVIEDYHYVGRVERVQFKPGAIEAIRRFNQAGIPVAIVTNQSGVARGFYSERDVRLVHDYICRELYRHGAYIETIFYSPHHPDGNVSEYIADTPYHKPAPGMAFQASAALGLDLHQSWVVGDRLTDVELAANIGANCVYLSTEPIPVQFLGKLKHQHFPFPGLHPFPSLADAASYIIERITGVTQSEFPTMHYNGYIGFFTHYADEIKSMLDLVNSHDSLANAADAIRGSYEIGTKVFVAGNGGAAAIASHMQTDHMKHMTADGRSFAPFVICLNSNMPLLTALANDIGQDAVFSWQLEQYAQRHDVLVVFSVSGNSPNIIRLLQAAREYDVKSIAAVGCDGGKAAGLADIVVHIPSSNYGVVEDVMSVIQHSWAQYIRQTVMTDEQIASARF